MLAYTINATHNLSGDYTRKNMEAQHTNKYEKKTVEFYINLFHQSSDICTFVILRRVSNAFMRARYKIVNGGL